MLPAIDYPANQAEVDDGRDRSRARHTDVVQDSLKEILAGGPQTGVVRIGCSLDCPIDS
jgi:hypothetical protein